MEAFEAVRPLLVRDLDRDREPVGSLRFLLLAMVEQNTLVDGKDVDKHPVTLWRLDNRFTIRQRSMTTQNMTLWTTGNHPRHGYFRMKCQERFRNVTADRSWHVFVCVNEKITGAALFTSTVPLPYGKK